MQMPQMARHVFMAALSRQAGVAVKSQLRGKHVAFPMSERKAKGFVKHVYT
jgi:hypothetical protein